MYVYQKVPPLPVAATEFFPVLCEFIKHARIIRDARTGEYVKG
jgi:hypothetical protein